MAARPRSHRGAVVRCGAARSAGRDPPMTSLRADGSASALSLYVHIPFCASRCPYCDFATAPATSRLRARYLDALITEIHREGARLGHARARTLYFGGGTPSLLEPDEIAPLGAALRESFELQ